MSYLCFPFLSFPLTMAGLPALTSEQLEAAGAGKNPLEIIQWLEMLEHSLQQASKVRSTAASSTSPKQTRPHPLQHTHALLHPHFSTLYLSQDQLKSGTEHVLKLLLFLLSTPYGKPVRYCASYVFKHAGQRPQRERREEKRREERERERGEREEVKRERESVCVCVCVCSPSLPLAPSPFLAPYTRIDDAAWCKPKTTVIGIAWRVRLRSCSTPRARPSWPGLWRSSTRS